MADFGETFDAEATEPAQDFDAIPAGKYPVMITESEKVENSSGAGSHIKLVMQVLDGPCKGRLLFHRLNLDNASSQAVQIARGQLSSICRAVKVLKPRDSTELHNLPLIVRVDVRVYEEKRYNDVKAFYPVDGAAPDAAPAGPAAPAAGPAAAPASAAPWGKKK